MDNKVTKKRINDHLEYDWYKYLIILLVGIVGFYFIFSQINRTRDYEDVTFFVSCYAANENNFSARAGRDMLAPSYDQEKYGEAVLREINIETQDPLGSEYATMLQTHGMVTSDVLIVGRDILESQGAGFVLLTDELLTEYLLPHDLTASAEGDTRQMEISDLEYFVSGEGTEHERRVGIKISDFARFKGKAGIFVTDWRDVQAYKEKYEAEKEENRPEDEFYLVINPSSVSIGKFGKKAKTENKQALYLVNRFIKYYYNNL